MTEFTPAQETIRNTIKGALFEVEQAGRNTPVADHLKGLTNAAHELQSLLGDAATLDKAFGPRGPQAASNVPEDVRAERKRERRAKIEQEARDAAEVLPGAVRSARAALFEATVPSGSPSRDEALTRDVIALELSRVAGEDGEVALSDAMIGIVRSAGFNSDEARVLAGRWGLAYARSRKQEGAHELLRNRLSTMAADLGDDTQKAAAATLRLFDERQVPGRTLGALQVTFGELDLPDMSGKLTRAFLSPLTAVRAHVPQPGRAVLSSRRGRAPQRPRGD